MRQTALAQVKVHREELEKKEEGNNTSSSVEVFVAVEIQL